MLYSAVSFLITLSNVAKFSMTYSVARPLYYSWACCTYRISHGS